MLEDILFIKWSLEYHFIVTSRSESFGCLAHSGFRTDILDALCNLERFDLMNLCRCQRSTNHKPLRVLNFEELYEFVNVEILGTLESFNVVNNDMLVQMDTVVYNLSLNFSEESLHDI